MALNPKKQINPETFSKLKEELKCLKKEKRREISEKLRQAISFGDLKENAAYHEAKDEQAFLEGRIKELENTINNSSIVSLNRKTNKVSIGSTVLTLINGEKNEYKIVDAIESDPLNGKISLESPIGKALSGRSKKEEFKIEMPSGETIEIEILEIK